MKIIEPIAIDNLNFSSSNVAETDYAAYNNSTSYSIGDRVILVSPSATVAMTVAAPCVVTWTAHGQPVNTPIKFSTTGALPTGIVAGTTYWITSVTADTFTFSKKKGGADIVATGTQSGTHTCTAQVHKIYESLINSNVGNYPSLATNSNKWQDRGNTNRWKVFDKSVTSQASNANSITYTFNVAQRINSIAVLNVSAASVHIVMHDTIDGDVYDQTFSLVSNSGINDAYRYCFDPIDRIQDFIRTDLPPYSNTTIAITLTATDETVLCGVILLGFGRKVGATQYGASVGIMDFSIKTRDAFNNLSITEREYSKKGNFQIWVEKTMTDALHTLLASYRAKEILYAASEPYSSTYLYGFFKDFSIVIDKPTASLCNIDIEGL